MIQSNSFSKVTEFKSGSILLQFSFALWWFWGQSFHKLKYFDSHLFLLPWVSYACYLSFLCIWYTVTASPGGITYTLHIAVRVTGRPEQEFGVAN